MLQTMWKILLVIGALSATSQPSFATECIEYGAVNLTGRLMRQTYAGPPDYESVTKGDAPQVVWILVLDRRICAVDPTSRYPKENAEQEIQLVLPAEQYSLYQTLLGERIAAVGQLIHGGAKYDKRLVLNATAVSKVGVLH
jgi:hypothetical protein